MTTIEPQESLALFRQMLLIRHTEEALARCHQRGLIHGACHTYVGQEAIAVGVCSHLETEDVVFSTHRGHGHALAKGVSPEQVMAELFGKSTGVTGGRGGSMHLFDVSKSFMGGYAIVAGHMPLACGLALGEQYKGSDRIVANFIGDGSVNEGAFHEALNLASVWKLPVIFICENNLYGMGTALRRVSALVEVYKRAEAYGIDAEQVDGMDVLAVREAVARLSAKVRAGEGPAFLEAICFRFRGHSMADADLYRTKDEVEHWRKLDPIAQLSHKLTTDKTIAKDDIAAMQARSDEMAADAARFAEESPNPPLESLTRHVYEEPADA